MDFIHLNLKGTIHYFFDSELQYQYAFVFYTAWNNLVLFNLIRRV